MVQEFEKKCRAHIWAFALYMVLLPIATSLSGIIGNISFLNYVAVLYLGIYILNKFSTLIVFQIEKDVFYFYYIFTLISAAYNPYTVSAWYVTTFASSGLILLFAMVDSYTKMEKQLIIKAIILSGIVSIIVTLLNIQTALDMRLAITLSSKMDSNDFACGMVIIISLLLTKLHNKKRRIFHILLLIGCTAIIILSGSRGAMLMGLSMLGVWIIISFKKKKAAVPFLIIIILAVLFLASYEFLPEFLIDRMKIDTLVEDGGSGRAEIWAHAIDEFKNSNFFEVVFGSGYGSFQGRVNYIAAGHSGAYQSHNMWINALIEGGLLGLTLMIIMFIKGFSIAKKNNNICGMLSVIGLAVAGCTLDSQSYRVFWIVFVVAIIFTGDDFDELPADISSDTGLQHSAVPS